jgi:hypothetical protein
MLNLVKLLSKINAFGINIHDFNANIKIYYNHIIII